MDDVKALFMVQDSDRSLWVLAKDWGEALEKWRRVIREENQLSTDEQPDPEGIHKVCGADDIIL